MSVSQWFKRNGIGPRPWIRDADCGHRQDLPWIGDTSPLPDELEQMRTICHGCPVIFSCADYGLTASGGYYAGVWVPWKSTTTDSEIMRGVRNRSRDVLRAISKRRLVKGTTR